MDKGIPHSEFLKWPEDDQDKAIAWVSAKAEVCDLCGSRESDWVDVETGRMLDEPKLTPIGIRDHGCAEIEAYRKATFPEGTPPGVRIVLMPNEMVGLDGKLVRK